MPPGSTPPLTPVNPRRDPFTFLLAVIVLAAATTGLGALAVFLDWHRGVMTIVASVAAIVAALPAAFLADRRHAERQQAQHAVQHIAARVGALVESAMDAIITVDESQRIVQFNAAAEQVFRWPRNAVVGQHLGLLLPERFRASHAAHIERFGATAATSRGMGTRMVLHGLRADGEEFPLEASISQHTERGHKLFTVILRDVTARLAAEELLARSEARLRSILDSAMDAIITVDERQHIALFNAAAEAVFGCPRDQAIGAPLEWFIPERFRAGHAAHVRSFGEARTASRRMGATRIVMGLRRNGEEFPIEASISQIESGGQRFYTVILRDVTERWIAEQALKASRDEIRELALSASNAREEEKSRVARELHDELGQSLTALQIDLTFLRDSLPGAAAAVQEKLTAMQALVDGTVTAARRISSELRPLMLDDLGLVAACDWLVQNLRQRTGIECELVIGAGDLDLPDPYATAVFRVLQESLTNVTKHASATRVEITLERGPESVTLTVRDNGRGFPAAGPRKAGTHGLTGLRERASLLQGAVAVESEPGRGTLVEMQIPFKPAPAP